jgi:hypothetical protein
MSVSQIDLHRQGKAGTLTGSEIASATVTDANLVVPYVKADGTRAMTAGLQGGGFEATNFATPTTGTSLATKAYVDAAAQGLSIRQSCRFATVGSETFTVVSGSVTVIAGTALDGGSPAIGDRLLVKDAPASTGVGSVNSLQPGNGIYTVTNATTNLTISRVADMATTNGPAGAFTFVEAGSANLSAGFVVASPSSAAAFTYGTTNMQWTQFSGAGEVTVANVLSKSGNQISVASMATGTAILGNAGTPTVTTVSGDIALGATGTATIQAAAVTLAKQANLAANSVIGNSTGSGATPTAVPLAIAATASAIAMRDANSNVTVNSALEKMQTIVSASGNTVLTVASPKVTQITGTAIQTVTLPDATTLTLGQQFKICNRSTLVVTLNANGAGLLQSMATNSQVEATLIAAGGAPGTWDIAYTAPGGTGTVTSASVVSANGFAGSVATSTTTPAITVSTSISGVLKGNGTAISAATAGAGGDYLAGASVITRETPTGSVNSANVTFTLANTPVAGTEQVFLNGILQEPGAGNDYTIATNTITYLAAPLTGDRLRVSYLK